MAPALPVEPDAGVYLDWVAAGMAGRMGYLTDHRSHIRVDPRLILPSALSVICVGRLYDPSGAGSPISRYAHGSDYHGTMRAGLERFVQRLRDEAGPFEYRICIDTAPLLERSYARLAGLGWIGRNTCLINEQLGSWLFLGEVLTSLSLEAGTPAPDRCGTCTRCIDACPTDAIVPGGMRTQVDARRCISYLTIELKGDIPEELRRDMGGHVFGCDICQEVCPWNSKVTPEPAEGDAIEQLASLTAEEFRERFRLTPVWRAKYSAFLRNVAVALGNSGETRHVPLLERLAALDDPVVSSHARRALENLSCASR